MSTIARDTGMGCRRSAVIWLVATMIGLPIALCGVLSTIWLVTAFDFKVWTLVVVAVLWTAPFVMAGAFLYVTVRRRAARLDALYHRASGGHRCACRYRRPAADGIVRTLADSAYRVHAG